MRARPLLMFVSSMVLALAARGASAATSLPAASGQVSTASMAMPLAQGGEIVSGVAQLDYTFTDSSGSGGSASVPPGAVMDSIWIGNLGGYNCSLDQIVVQHQGLAWQVASGQYVGCNAAIPCKPSLIPTLAAGDWRADVFCRAVVPPAMVRFSLFVAWHLPYSVTVAPASIVLRQGESTTFTAVVTNGSSAGVTWRATGGAIHATTGQYTAPNAAGTYTVTATKPPEQLWSDISRQGSATVTVQAVSTTIAPSSATVTPGGTLQFTASVQGTVQSGVTWSVAEGSIGGSVSASGLYTAPVAAGTYHVVATSVADRTKKASATVTVPPVAVAISPVSATVRPGRSTQLGATVTNTTNVGVTWSIQEGPNGGSVSTTGFYTAPWVGGTYHVLARSVADPTKVATATVTVPPLDVSVVPSTVRLVAGGSIRLVAAVSDAPGSGMSWSVLEGPDGGSIAQDGTYTAPTRSGIYHVVATSLLDGTRSGIATVTVIQPVTLVGSSSEYLAIDAQEGDVIVAVLSVPPFFGSYTPLPAGWSEVVHVPNETLVVLWRRVTAADPLEGLPSRYVAYANFRGVARAGSPFEAMAHAEGDTIDSITTVTPGAMVLLGAGILAFDQGECAIAEVGIPVSGPSQPATGGSWDGCTFDAAAAALFQASSPVPGPTGQAIASFYGHPTSWTGVALMVLRPEVP